MKPCIDCQHNHPTGCAKSKKTQTCKKFEAISMDKLNQERKALLVSKQNPTRLQYLQKKIDYFNYGIK